MRKAFLPKNGSEQKRLDQLVTQTYEVQQSLLSVLQQD